MAKNQATGQEAGAVYVSVMPSGRGFSKAMDNDLSSSFTSSASKGTATFGQMFRKIAAVGASVLAAVGIGKLIKNTIELGVSYNTLEQSSKAAFTTLLGTADAAAAMQKKIRDFAMTSPFPRQAFIEATQQLLSFGFSADQVVPTLGAIQDAVAAIGGTSSDIGAITDVLAKVRSGATLGINELDQLAQHGINGYAILAKSQGKTEQEFRDSIYGSPLKGSDALSGLDALISGMEEKFSGAAANLKGTFVGAKDRIAGAWRDLSSELLAPFVDPNGGGYAVKWANEFADLLRTIQASAGFDALKQKLADFGKTLDPIVSQATTLVSLLFETNGKAKFFDALSNIPALAPFADALKSISEMVTKLAPVAPALGDALLKVAEALLTKGVIDALTKLVVTVLPPLADLLVAIAPLIPPLAQLLGFLLPLAIAAVTFVVEGLTEELSLLIDLFTKDDSMTAWANRIINGTGPLTQVMRDVSSIIFGISNALIDGVAGMWNGMTDIINAGMKLLIDGFNTLSGLLGGGKIKQVLIPHITPGHLVNPLAVTRKTLNSTAAGLADSGTVLPRPGGTLILAAEAGRAESVVDTGKLNGLMDAAASGGGADRPIYMDGSLFGVLRTLANGEARIVLNTVVNSAVPAGYGSKR